MSRLFQLSLILIVLMVVTSCGESPGPAPDGGDGEGLCSKVEILEEAIPAVVMNAAFSFLPEARGGLEPYLWSLEAGGLPAGVELDTATGEVGGTPTEEGQAFVLKVTDSCVPPQTALRSFTLDVRPPLCSPVVLQEQTLSDAFLEIESEYTLEVSGGLAPYTLALVSGELPPGLELDGATGVIRGVPAMIGTFAFTLQAWDSCVPPGQDTQDFRIGVNDGSGLCPHLTVANQGLDTGIVGEPYTVELMADGGTAPLTWSLSMGSLPEGLGLQPSGRILGEPLVAGHWEFSLEASDSCIPPLRASADLSMTVVEPQCPALAIQAEEAQRGGVGLDYSLQVEASGGVPPYTYSVSAGTLPEGLFLNPVDGLIGGVTEVAGLSSFSVQGTDSCSPPQTQTVELFILVICPEFTITTTAVPVGEVESPYEAVFTATGGIPPYTWNIVDGVLPDGLTFDGEAGVLSGTPTQRGVFPITLSLSDSCSTQSLNGQITLLIGLWREGDIAIANDSNAWMAPAAEYHCAPMNSDTCFYQFWVRNLNVSGGSCDLNVLKERADGTTDDLGTFTMRTNDRLDDLDNGNLFVEMKGTMTCQPSEVGACQLYVSWFGP